MKVFLVFICFLLSTYLFSQNSVGIGTSNPQATLDVVRGTAPNGTAAFRGSTNTSNFNLGVNEDTYISGGKLGSNVILNDLGNGKVGIGTIPQTRLDIAGTSSWDLVGGEGDFRLGNSTYRLKMGVALNGGGAGAVGVMQYGVVGGYNALSLGSQGKYLITLYGDNNIVELANVVNGKVGIGTSAPFSPLTFNNNSGQKISLYGTSTNNYGFGITGSTLQIHSDAAEADIAFGYGSSSTFTEIMRIKGSGRVGIGVPDPQQFLSIKSGMNIDQADLNRGSLDNNVFRFGSFSGEAIGSARGSGDNVWGLDFYTSSIKRMVITNGGNVGIGVNPAYKLDVNGRMRIRSGGDNFSTAGLWFNNTSNIEAAFIGMANDTHVGFYGTGAGFKFTMNTQTGALEINGSEGTAGQVLQSNGGSSPTWSSPTNAMYNNLVQVRATSSLSSESSIPALIPGMTYSFTTAGECKVIVSFSVQVYPGICIGCTGSEAVLNLFNNGTSMELWRFAVGNGATTTLSASVVIGAGPGNNIIELKGFRNGPNVYFAYGGGANNMILQIIPE